MKRFLIFACAVLLSACAPKAPVSVIFDTDMGPDYDDVGALAILHAMADAGEVDILATVSSNKDELAVPCIEVINTYYGRGEIPLGAAKGAAPSMNTWHSGLKWTQELPARYPHKVTGTSQAEDAVAVYRRILSTQPDSSVTIVTVGFLSNLRDLLLSGPDEYSPLSGAELVSAKVRALVSMAGFNAAERREFNVVLDPGAAVCVFSRWPTPIYISGFDIGVKVITGRETAAMEVESPVRDAYRMALAQDDPAGRMSWDQTAVLAAVRGTGDYYTAQSGTMTVDSTGMDTWMPGDGLHYRLIEKMPAADVAAVIEELMMRPSKKR